MIDRYKLVQTPDSRYAKMERDPEGGFVLYVDHLDTQFEQYKRDQITEKMEKDND